MSNHRGGNLINDVISYLWEDKQLLQLPLDQRRNMLNGILKIGRMHDCNDSEIIGGLWRLFGICRYCSVESDVIINGHCSECYSIYYGKKAVEEALSKAKAIKPGNYGNNLVLWIEDEDSDCFDSYEEEDSCIEIAIVLDNKIEVISFVKTKLHEIHARKNEEAKHMVHAQRQGMFMDMYT